MSVMKNLDKNNEIYEEEHNPQSRPESLLHGSESQESTKLNDDKVESGHRPDIGTGLDIKCQVLINLFGRVIITAWDFICRPAQFSFLFLNSDKTGKPFSDRYVQPPTFYVLCAGLYAVCILIIKNMKPHAYNILSGISNKYKCVPLIDMFSEAIKDISKTKMIIALSPYFVAFMLFACSMYLVTKVSWMIKHQPTPATFTRHIKLAAYFEGVIALLLVITIPVRLFFLPSSTQKPDEYFGSMHFLVFISIMYGVQLISALFYARLLKYIFKTTLLKSFILVMCGLFMFYVLYIFFNNPLYNMKIWPT